MHSSFGKLNVEAFQKCPYVFCIKIHWVVRCWESKIYKKSPFQASFHFRLFNTVSTPLILSTNFLPMTGFEPQISGV